MTTSLNDVLALTTRLVQVCPSCEIGQHQYDEVEEEQFDRPELTLRRQPCSCSECLRCPGSEVTVVPRQSRPGRHRADR
jgi:hypothetical protein